MDRPSTHAAVECDPCLGDKPEENHRYYSPTTYRMLLELAGFEVFEVRMRQPRVLTYGKAGVSSAAGLLVQAVSVAEWVSNRQSWVEVRAAKVRDA